MIRRSGPETADELTTFGPTEPEWPAAPDAARPLFFGPPAKPLFGWYHPARALGVRTNAVVLCPPLGYEYMCSHRALRHLAEEMAAAGHHVLRFDYYGTGNSSGHVADVRQVAAWLDSIRCAIDELRARTGGRQVTLVGLRLGATLAAATAAGRSDVGGVVLWHPCVSGKSYVRELRALRMTSMAEDVAGPALSPAPMPSRDLEAAGFSLTPATVAELGALDLLRMRGRPAPAVLVIGRDDLGRDETLVEHLRSTGAVATQQRLPGYAELMVMPLRSEPPRASMDAITAWLGGAPSADTGAEGCEACGTGIGVGSGSPPPAAMPATLGRPMASSAIVPVGAGDAGLLVRETAVAFGERGRLFGILTEPVERDGARPAIVLLNTGGDHHVGPHRLYAPLAREWAALGFPVLRFDLGGLGESKPRDGAAENDAYPPMALDDVRAAMSLLSARGIERVVLAGVCSGGYHALHAARGGALPVVGRIAINPPLYWRPGDAVDVDRSWNHQEMQRLARSLFQRSKWERALRGQVDFKYIGSVIATKATMIAHSRLWSLRRMIDGPVGAGSADTEFSELFPPHLDTFLVFSHGDPGLAYTERSAGPELGLWRSRSTFRLDVIDGPDHTFMSLEWQRRLRALLTDYLVERYGAG